MVALSGDYRAIARAIAVGAPDDVLVES
jgi:hypothetical protein